MEVVQAFFEKRKDESNQSDEKTVDSV